MTLGFMHNNFPSEKEEEDEETTMIKRERNDNQGRKIILFQPHITKATLRHKPSHQTSIHIYIKKFLLAQNFRYLEVTQVFLQNGV
jgi:hypothetical protein